MRSLLRLSAWLEYLRGSLWFMPALFVAAALALGSWLAVARPDVDAQQGMMLYGGSAEGARNLLSVLAGAMITVTALTFSLTVVALQMAASQFSPRVLRGFLTDRGNQFVLSMLLGAFAYCLAVLRLIREGEGAEEVVPRLAVTVGVALTMVAVGSLVYFIHHVTQRLRPERIMREASQDTLGAIDEAHPGSVHDGGPGLPPDPPPSAHRVAAKRSGYLQAVNRRGLAAQGRQHDVIVRLRPAIGAHVAEGTTLAWVWRPGATLDSEGGKRLDRMAHDHVHVGMERTMQQDVAFGVRQLVDVALKALSTGMNDPTTTVDALAHLSVVLCRLTERQLGATVVRDDDDAIRALVPAPAFRDYLALVCDPVRHHGCSDPEVLLAILGLLTDVAELVATDEQRRAVRMQVSRTVEVAAGHLDQRQRPGIEAAAELACDTLDRGQRPG